MTKEEIAKLERDIEAQVSKLEEDVAAMESSVASKGTSDDDSKVDNVLEGFDD